MNPDTNLFEPLSIIADLKALHDEWDTLVRPDGTPVPQHWSIFTVGAIYEINGYSFKCVYIGESNILFEPVGTLIINGTGGDCG